MASRALKNWVRKSALRVTPKPVEPLGKWRIGRGDKVAVLSGEDRGKDGVIKSVNRKTNTVIVEGLNLVRRAVRPTEGSPGGIISVEAPIHVSNVNVVDPTNGKPVKIAMRYTEDGAKVRVSRKTGAVIPTPDRSKFRAARPADPGPRDTPAEEVQRKTYNPPAELIPFLSAATAAPGSSLFRRRLTGDVDKLPEVLKLKLRRKDRNRLREKFERQVTLARVAEMRSAQAAPLQ